MNLNVNKINYDLIIMIFYCTQHIMKISQQLLRLLQKLQWVKSIKKLTANESKSDLGYLNKLVDEYNNNYHRFIGRKPVNADYSALTEDIESSHKASRFKVSDRVRITKYKNIFRKGYTKKWSREIFGTDSMLKTNPWTYKTKDLNGEKNIKKLL